jgi:hypothetical protein
MTAFDAFDAFDAIDRRIADAMAEMSGARTPDYLDELFARTSAIAQRRRWTFGPSWLSGEPARQSGRTLRDGIRLALVLGLITLLAFAAILVASRPVRADDRILALVRSEGVYLQEPGATAHRIRAGSFTDLAWSPDGTSLAVQENYPDTGELPGITVLDLRGNTIGRIAASQPGVPLIWSSSGRLVTLEGIGLMSGATGLVAAAPDGSGSWTARLPDDGGRTWRTPLTIAWRPGDAWVAVDLRREANLCHETVLISATDPEHRAVLFADQEAASDCVPHRPAWNSTGTQLAMLRSGSADDCWPWAPDDSACRSDLVVYDITGADPTAPRLEPRVIDSDVYAYGQPLWLPADDGLLVTKRFADGADSTVELSVVRADGGGRRSVGILRTGSPMVAWDVPGESVLYVVEHPTQPAFSGGAPMSWKELRIFDLRTGNSRSIATDVFAGSFQPATMDASPR